jgi:uncharacterized protein (TIGR03437 family)
MKRDILSITAICLCFLFWPVAQATALPGSSLPVSAGQWTLMGGVIGGNNPTLVMSSHKGSLYVAVEEDGIFRSTDQGRTWSAVNTGIPEAPFVGRSAYAFVVSGNDLFVGAGGVYRLNSQGDGWVSVNNGLPTVFQIPLPVAALTVSGTTLFAAISSPAFSGPKVYRSTNQGLNWEPAAGGFPPDPLNPQLASTDSTVLVTTDSQGIYRSTDQGRTWTAANAGLGNFSSGIAELIAAGPDFYAALSADGIYRSTDQGQSWTKVSDLRLDPFGFDKMEADGSNLLAISNSRVYLSTDQGGNWTLLSDGVTQAPFSKLAVIGNQIFTTGVGRTIYSGTGFLPSSLAVVSAASFSGSSVAPESIVAAFGTRLATGTQAATAFPLPTQLAGTQVMVKDSAGVERLAPLFFVSPGQVNCLMPGGVRAGAATVTITSGDGSLAASAVNIANLAPGLFTANADGQGVPAGVVTGPRGFQAIAQLDAQGRFVPAPIDLGPPGQSVYLVLFGTGLRFRTNTSPVKVKIGGVDISAGYAGPQGDFSGLDQINIELPRELIGRGEVDLVLTVDGIMANTARVWIK